MVVFSAARAEEGIPAGSGAVITAGAPLAVRSAPGWDAAVSYEIADGSYVTVWDVAHAAPDGSLWYPIDGGFVPVEAVASVATKDSTTLYQETVPNESVEPATAGGVGADLTAADPQSATATNESVAPSTTDTIGETASKEALVDSAGSVDPVQDESTGSRAVDPASAAATDGPTSDEQTDLATDPVVAPVPVDAAPIDPAASTEPSPLSTSSTEETEPWGEPIATAYVTGTGGDGAPCLAAPQWGAETLAVLGEGEPVEVRAETMGEWQPVNCAGAGGYVQAAQIAWTPLEQVNPGAAPEADDDGGRRDRKAADGGSEGNDIVDFAMKYEGHPYVYAGEGPRAFDCSGFTMFVIKKTLGLDITHDMAVQYEMGSHVGRNELQPGDLVFFKNTYRRGLSHTGIYIGGGQFIHAENESTGVRVSDLDSDYYSSRWYGAARFA
jgi:cell wall-associated NlpC family hydrolase